MASVELKDIAKSYGAVEVIAKSKIICWCFFYFFSV